MDYKINNRVKYLYKVLCETEKIYYSMLKHAKITDSEYVLLFSVLEMGEGCSQKDISTNTYTSTKTLNSAVKKLEQKGLIKLTRGKYPNMYIYLTPEGKKYIQEKMIPITNTVNKILENISDEEFDKFKSITSNIFSKFEETDLK